MGVKPQTRAELLQIIRDEYESDADREIAARCLITSYPAILKNFCAVVKMVTEDYDLTPAMFDLLSVAWETVRPNVSLDAAG